MIRKLVVTGLVLVGAGTFLFGRDGWSYVKTCGRSVRSAVHNEVPLEFQVERARQMIADLEPEIRKSMHVVAEQQVEVEDLSLAIASRQERLNGQQDAILALRDRLNNPTQLSSYEIGGREYSQDKVEKDLERRFKRFKVADATLEKEREILSAREKALDANTRRLEEMLSAKKELEVEVEQLEARLRSIRAAETASSLALDDSQVSRAKKLIKSLDKELDVKERLLDSEGNFDGLIPIELETEESVSGDVRDEIDEYFGVEPEIDMQDAT